MPPLADRQRAFAGALLNRGRAMPPNLVGPDGEPSPRRFGIYRNNIVASLTEALESMFPAVCRIVGDEFFRAMARSYFLGSPPSSPILLDYGGSFADFIAGFEPAATLPYLADIARIERAWSEAYHAAEAVPLVASVFGTIPGDRLTDISLSLHPSLRIVRSSFPALTIWRMNVGDGVPGPVDFSVSEDTLIIRPRAEVEARSMPPGGAEFLAALSAGNSIGAATRMALEAQPSFNLETNLVGLFGAEVFIGYSLAEGSLVPEE